MKYFNVLKSVTNITSVLLITISSMGSALMLPQVAHATDTTAVSISNITDLRNAVETQADGQIWTIKAGDYGLDRFNDIPAGGETGWYLPITAS